MIKAVLLFILGLILLIKGGDWFVDSSVNIAHKFKLPEILIGATVVSIGTTLPEVMVSGTSAVKGISSIAYGNAIGSIICNTALISALTIAIRPAKIEKDKLIIPVVFFFISAVFYSLVAYFSGEFSRVAGIILLATFVVYMVLTTRSSIKASKQTADEETKEEINVVKSIVFLIIGAALIAYGANLLTDNGTIIAEGLGVPSSVIALTFVALGTSLPELVTAITSLVKGHGALSVGNIIGANLFNLILVSGVAVTLKPFAIPSEKLIGGINASLVVDIPVMFAVMLILTLPAVIWGKLSRVQGISLLAIYTAFCVFQFAF